MFLQQPRRHKPNTGSRGLLLNAWKGVFWSQSATAKCHEIHTGPLPEKSLTCFSHWRANGRGQSSFLLSRCIPVFLLTHTHTQSQSRERSTGLRFVRFCLQQQFCNYSKCFSNLYAHFFVFVSAAPLLCRCTLCRELIWQNDDSSESVQCINDFVFWISSLCSSLFFLCKLFVVQSINAVPTREAQTNRNYVHIQQICSSK